MRKLILIGLSATTLVAACRKAPPPLPEGHWERRLDKGRIVIFENVDTKYMPVTTIIVPDEKAKATIETLFRAAFPDLMGPYEKRNFNGTLNYSLGVEFDTRILTLKEYEDPLASSLYAHRNSAEVRRELKDHDVVIYRHFAPKDLFRPKKR